MPIVIIGLGIAVVVMLSWFAAAGTQRIYNQSLGAAIRWIARELQGIHSGGFIGALSFLNAHPFSGLARRIESFDHTIQHSLGTIAHKNGAKLASYLMHLALLWTGVGYVVDLLAYRTLHALQTLRHSTLPKVVNGRVRPLQAQVNRLTKSEAAIAHDAIPRVGRRARTAEQEAHGIGKRVGALAGAVGAALVGAPSAALDWPGAKTGTRARPGTSVKSRLGRLERLLIGAGVGALVWAGLRTLSLKWLRCWKVNKLGRGLCGMNPHWFNDILGLLTDFLLLRSICDVLPLLTAGANDIGVPLVELLTRAESFIDCSSDRADDLPPITLHLPPGA